MPSPLGPYWPQHFYPLRSIDDGNPCERLQDQEIFVACNNHIHGGRTGRSLRSRNSGTLIGATAATIRQRSRMKSQLQFTSKPRSATCLASLGRRSTSLNSASNSSV